MIKEYRNNSNEYDALTMSRLCKQNHQSDSGVSIILYGNYFYNEDKKVGEYKKFFIHKGSLVHSDDSVFKYIGDRFLLAIKTLPKLSAVIEPGT